MTTTALLAQQDPAAGAKPGGEMPFFANPLIIFALIGLYLLVVVLPQNRRQKRDQANLLATLKPGAKVVTASGIVGVVIKAKDGEDEITLRSEDAKIRVLRSTVTRVVGADETAAEAKS